MTYSVELLMDLKKNKNLQGTKDTMQNLATENNCSFQYFQHETAGTGRQIKDNICIHKIDFENDENEPSSFDNLLEFIRQVLSPINAIKHTKIDNIYCDTKPFYFLIKERKRLNPDHISNEKQKLECIQLNRLFW